MVVLPAFAVALAVSIVFATVARVSAKRGWRFSAFLAGLFATLALPVAVGTALLVAATVGYRALTREELAAVIRTRPTGPQQFEAVFVFPDGRERAYQRSGDQLAVDARVLKWKPAVNLLGLHTAYRLDRVSGRYADIEHEKTRPRTVYALEEPRRLDLFDLRRRHTLLAPLVDAEYGSGTFVSADEVARLELRVSTTGLLLRGVSARIGPGSP